MKSWVIFRAGHGQSVCFSLWLYHYCNGHWINQSTCILTLRVTKLIKAIFSPHSLVSVCSPVSMSWSPLLRGLPALLGPWLPGPTPWGLLPGQGNHFRFSSLPGSASLSWVYLGPQCLCQPSLNPATRSGRLQRAAGSAPGPEQLEPKPGDPAVLCSSLGVFELQCLTSPHTASKILEKFSLKFKTV